MRVRALAQASVPQPPRDQKLVVIVLPIIEARSGSIVADAERPGLRPGEIPWRYTLQELWADGVVHAAGLAFVAVGSIALAAAVRTASGAAIAATAAYLAALCLSFAASAAYNIWPPSATKWVLRRFDQSAIYLLIAGTYTPFLVTMSAWGALAGVWSAAAVGMALRMWRPGHFDRLSIALYLLLGWSGVLMLDRVITQLPAGVPWLIAGGGLTYSLGVIFHVWGRLRFQNAIWHVFVLAAASIHYLAVWSTMISAA